MAKRDRVRAAEHLGNDWAVRKHSARRAVEAAERQQEAMLRSASATEHAYAQRQILIQQNSHVIAQQDRLISLGERTNELLSYLADRAFDESQARGGAPGDDEAPGP